MGRKLSLKSLFKKGNPKPFFSNSSSPSPWPWPSCRQPKTQSFRLLTNDDHPPYPDSTDTCFTTSSSIESESFSASDCSEEAVMQAKSSKRLFFDGGPPKRRKELGVPFEGSVAVLVESKDPYRDFRVSMKEMVEADGEAKGSEWLEEMLAWYLTVNKKMTHEFIIEAYWDLLLEIMGSSSSSFTTTASRSSSSSSSYFSCLTDIEEEEGNT